MLKFLSIRSFDSKYVIDTTTIDESIEEEYSLIPKKQQVKKVKAYKEKQTQSETT